MKLGTIVNDQFKSTVVKLLPQEMPIKTTVMLEGIVSLLNKAIDKYDLDRQALLDKYGEKDSDGKLVVNENRSVQFSTDNLMLYSKDYNELCGREVEVPTISVQELGDKVTISYDDLQKLGGLILR